MRRLADDALSALPDDIVRPTYDRANARIGVVHLGVGNFHRAHQAVAFDDLLSRGDARWGICGVSLKRPTMRDALAPQDGLYTLLERDGTGTRARVIGALRALQVAPESPPAVIERLAAPDTRLVTLTITEKGYDETGPTSAVGLLAAGLDARRAASRGGLTLMSCDNLPRNGARLAARLGEAARTIDASLPDWIAREVACPDSMVDRIVPATLDADRTEAASRLRCEDAWPVTAEPFSQWVIERRVVGEAPPLEVAGVQWVDDVAPWEAMKLRLLNAAHSTLAYLGAPAGLATVDAAIGEPQLRAFVERLWRQAAVTLPASVRDAAPAYGERLLARFANPALHHRLLQIAMDGSKKLPQRLVETLREARHSGAPHDALLLAVAAWMRFCAGRDEAGAGLPLDDPLADRLRAAAAQSGDPRATVRAMLAIEDVFGDAGAEPALVDALAAALDALRRHGSIGTLEANGAPIALSSAARRA
ncbi:MAG: mannitol dehydrogenase family protein [Burkholderiaceae bacterium]